jgi:hypothetical protein
MQVGLETLAAEGKTNGYEVPSTRWYVTFAPAAG